MLTALLQLYREANLLQNVLRQKNSNHYNPLRSAVVNHQFENTVLLFKECLAVAEDAITELDANSKEDNNTHCNTCLRISHACEYLSYV